MERFKAQIDPQVALALYDDGAKDTVIASQFGVTPSSIVHWRKRNGLPSKHSNKLDPEAVRQARKLLRSGATRCDVSDATGLCPTAVLGLRKRMPNAGLRKIGITLRVSRARAVNDNDLYPRILRAIGSGLPRDVKHDAANEMYVDVLGGRLSPDLIEARAPRYRNWAWGINGSNYGPVSLDATNDAGFSLGATLEDNSAINDMEAAAERGWGMRLRILEVL